MRPHPPSRRSRWRSSSAWLGGRLLAKGVGQLVPAGDAELGVDPLEVVLDRPVRQEQPLGYHLARHSSGGHVCDLPLTRRERRDTLQLGDGRRLCSFTVVQQTARPMRERPSTATLADAFERLGGGRSCFCGEESSAHAVEGRGNVFQGRAIVGRQRSYVSRPGADQRRLGRRRDGLHAGERSVGVAQAGHVVEEP